MPNYCVSSQAARRPARAEFPVVRAERPAAARLPVGLLHHCTGSGHATRLRCAC